MFWPPMEWSAMERTRLGLIAIVFAVIGALSAVDVSFARVESQETAHRLANTTNPARACSRPTAAPGHRSSSQGPRDGSQRFPLRAAAGGGADPGGKVDEAQAMLADILDRMPNDGEANLLEARLLVRQGGLADAAASYHRAIYGTWRDNRTRTVQARLELANLLAASGSDRSCLPNFCRSKPKRRTTSPSGTRWPLISGRRGSREG